MHKTTPPKQWLRWGLRLEYLTLGWNVIGTGVVILAASATSSAALAGFGIDSMIEIFASVVVIWQLTDSHQKREKIALRLISMAFFALALYILTAIRQPCCFPRPIPANPSLVFCG